MSDHPDFGTAHWGLGLAYEQKKLYNEASVELQKAAERKGTNSLASLGHLYGVIGRKKEARDILSELTKRAGKESVSAYQLALVHIGLGDIEAAMEALQQAYREHATLLSYLKMDSRALSSRGDPRFHYSGGG